MKNAPLLQDVQAIHEINDSLLFALANELFAPDFQKLIKGTAKSSIEVACSGGTPQLSSELGTYLVNGACLGGITFKDATVDFVFDKAFKVGSTLVTGIGSGIVVVNNKHTKAPTP